MFPFLSHSDAKATCAAAGAAQAPQVGPGGPHVAEMVALGLEGFQVGKARFLSHLSRGCVPDGI